MRSKGYSWAENWVWLLVRSSFGSKTGEPRWRFVLVLVFPKLGCFFLFDAKIWFFFSFSILSKTTQAQHERADNCALRSENDKIRCENIAIREALKNVICLSCGGPPINDDCYFDEQKIRMENAQLKEEVIYNIYTHIYVCMYLYIYSFFLFPIVRIICFVLVKFHFSLTEYQALLPST